MVKKMLEISSLDRITDIIKWQGNWLKLYNAINSSWSKLPCLVLWVKWYYLQEMTTLVSTDTTDSKQEEKNSCLIPGPGTWPCGPETWTSGLIWYLILSPGRLLLLLLLSVLSLNKPHPFILWLLIRVQTVTVSAGVSLSLTVVAWHRTAQ